MPRIPIMPAREDHSARAARTARWRHRAAIGVGIIWAAALLAGAAGFAYAMSP